MILGVESSCDESALALFDPDSGIYQEGIASQVELHRAYGGVVPEVASRKHLEMFTPLFHECIGGDRLEPIRKIAVTSGPGLASCLALGVSFAKALAFALKVPIYGVNHMRGHAFSPFMALHADDPKGFETAFKRHLPHLGVIASGGHTLLFVIDTQGAIETIATTVDDAAGEALDKGAKLLGLPYPGGPEIERIAKRGNPSAYKFPRAFPSKSDLKFSFSGLKTSLRYQIESMDDDHLNTDLEDICASYQFAVVDALRHKAQQLIKANSFKSLGLSGGVANNDTLRGTMTALAAAHDLSFLAAQKKHTGDNAAMIAFASFIDPSACISNDGFELSISPSLSLDATSACGRIS